MFSIFILVPFSIQRMARDIRILDIAISNCHQCVQLCPKRVLSSEEDLKKKRKKFKKVNQQDKKSHFNNVNMEVNIFVTHYVVY